MVKGLFFSIFCLLYLAGGTQDFIATVKDAFVITRMAEKFHLQPKPVNNELSHFVFDAFIDELDRNRIYFSQEDITDFSMYAGTIDDEIIHKKDQFLRFVFNRYQLRLSQTDSIINQLCRSPFDFTRDEMYTAAEDTSFAANETERADKIRQLLKSKVLHYLVSDSNITSGKATVHYTDSIEALSRQKVKSAYLRRIASMHQGEGGLPQTVGQDYCKAIALYYDPHTEYLPITEKENFEGEIGNNALAFGFTLKEAANGGVIIVDLEPGGPAFNSGLLNKYDKIEMLQWHGKEKIDVSDAEVQEVAQLLHASNHDQLLIKVRKTDGTYREVTLVKEKIEDNSEGNKVKSFVLKGATTVGYISLPSFYEDWENPQSGTKGSTHDVAKQIARLKKENIDGLILDLRYNGGGSMEEAVSLAGIFIDAGPIAQMQTRNNKIFTLRDEHRGVVYSGPLLLMVNGQSASASELFAATLQDHHRAVIVGSATYGKATGQVILPMDTTFNSSPAMSKVNANSYLKLTVSQMYRLNGTTPQATGVQPDVQLPDILETQTEKEVDQPRVIAPATIPASKLSRNSNLQYINSVKQTARDVVQSSGFFRQLSLYIEKVKAASQPADISLQLQRSIQESKQQQKQKPIDVIKPDESLFSISNLKEEIRRLANNTRLQEINQDYINMLLHDPYLSFSYRLLAQSK